MLIYDITMSMYYHSSHGKWQLHKAIQVLGLVGKIWKAVFAWTILSCIIVTHSWGKHLDQYQLVAYRSQCAHALFKCMCNFVASSREAYVPSWCSFRREWYLSQLEQWRKLSPGLLALYSSKIQRQFLLKFNNDTSFNPNELFTSLSFGTSISFYLQVARRTFVTTFFLHVRTRDLWGMWLVDLSTMH